MGVCAHFSRYAKFHSKEVHMKKGILRTAVILLLLFVPIYNFVGIAAEGTETVSEPSVTDISAVDELVHQNVAQIEAKIDRIDEEKRINKLLLEQKKEREQNEKRLREQIKSGAVTYRQIFADTLIVGDSLMKGLRTHGIIDSANMITMVNAHLSHLASNIGTIINNNPKVLILHYGINMIELSDAHLNNFIKNYSSHISKIKAALPGTRIIVSGLFRPSDEAIAHTSRFGRTPQYNAALKNMCETLGVEFLDNGKLLKGTEDVYTNDGVHFKKSFYTDTWLPYTVLELGL